MKTARAAAHPDSSKSAYFRALRWLTARELSERQVRERLAECGYTDAAIGPAVERLLEDRTLDDRRAATAVARAEAKVRRHGPRRVLARLAAMKIDRDLATEVVRELFGDSDEADLVAQALERRLRGNPARLKDPAERRRLLAYLVRQGFSPSAASTMMRRLSRRAENGEVK